ncbi:MAG: BamA/TamA family outer membrane protein [Alphaproteobacteria bacterium]|uniref:autotransporter assembly complex protein TamA n=1 Tax=Hyphomonas sp. TaxID=87 RepID=UPI001E0FBF71|nr:BamA/TamA family outer membrane protein [Hyphomonas sp.]MBU4062602.1 BamA/TamA family outer membrane protein [Alphaproteobacteria bacterium]MBU4163953.1 BamA/TamA family outer membrane protein [Alphaproteobacteria bacterium]MBU4569438.1 BamA/TamA family outer membrane protein [Alphaproteobacteria bacterium]
MKEAKPAKAWTIARPLAGACLLAATSACAAIPGLGGASTQEAAKTPRASIEGMPPALAPRANELVRVAEPAPRSVLEARNRLNKSADLLRDLMSSEGYLAAEVAPSRIDSTDDAVVLVAQPGPLFMVASRTFAGREQIVPEVARELEDVLADLPAGATARTATIERIDDLLVKSLRQQGYAFAASQGIDVLASRADETVELTFLLVPGPRVALGGLELPGIDARGSKMIRSLTTWKDGDLYNPAIVDKFRTRLRATGLYDGIGVTVADMPGTDGLHMVTATLVEADRRTVSLGVTASTTEGVGVDGYWERRNLTGRADRLRIRGEVATLARNLTATYERPNIGKYGRTLSLEAGVRAEETDAYDLQGVLIGASLSQPFTKNLTLSVGTALDATRTLDRRAKIVGGIERDQLTLSFPVVASYSDVGDLLDPQSGLRMMAGAEAGVSVGDGTPGYTRLHLSGATYRAITDNVVAAFRAEFGAFVGSNAVPPDKLFFAGGGGTVRGYEYQSLSPRDSSGLLTGGRNLFAASAELRWRATERFGYALFTDFGAATDDAGSVFSEGAASLGVGLRYYPGFGPIRLDIATPLDKRDGDAPVQVYISIGQAF